jgi:hypothetical protein
MSVGDLLRQVVGWAVTVARPEDALHNARHGQAGVDHTPGIRLHPLLQLLYDSKQLYCATGPGQFNDLQITKVLLEQYADLCNKSSTKPARQVLYKTDLLWAEYSRYTYWMGLV